ncbi:MAG: bifunctional hydroxymethylpyrimidine kinase/phosphomethylpyrimidine kinase [Hyphomicrobium sp.]|nr:bifunctional hydroxymethylpyrimidine kinase/phosphomethylpyrimidine kinase [Hyphomicrobium sp.]
MTENSMGRVLVISSFVAKGTVGLQAALPAFAAAGIETVALPTVLLSNHPGFAACAGTQIACETLDAMLDALDANGWLSSIDAIFTGYLPSADHVRFARGAVERVKAANAMVLYLADPVLGDDPEGLYVSHDAAIAVRDVLVPLAAITTPNRFELAWLSGRDVIDRTTAVSAARSLGVPHVAATSIPAGDEHLENVLVSGGEATVETVARRAAAPHGTGDYFAGALLAALLRGACYADAMAAASRLTDRLVAASQHRSDLEFAAVHN